MMPRFAKTVSILAVLITGCISSNVNADAIEYENKYSDEVPYIDIYSFPEYGKAEVPDAEMTPIWESSPEIKNEAYYTSPHTIIKRSGKVQYALARVYGSGYAIPDAFDDLVLINCQNPRHSYIERGDRERISLKDSMAIGGEYGPGLSDERWHDHIPRGAVSALFNFYCKG
ncbi:hypothetical protein [Psychrobacter sp. I-STPA6b]|uniref:hypothetical protein n=1 Tax=Psychrobacter sp. I-STPA6b TaxID=2585718 RepID=UPI001D0C4815|nr:hypothetical protein [Psychrobacter sp. I-STPA6b]